MTLRLIDTDPGAFTASVPPGARIIAAVEIDGYRSGALVRYDSGLFALVNQGEESALPQEDVARFVESSGLGQCSSCGDYRHLVDPPTTSYRRCYSCYYYGGPTRREYAGD